MCDFFVFIEQMTIYLRGCEFLRCVVDLWRSKSLVVEIICSTAVDY